jgi:hypothetical protein
MHDATVPQTGCGVLVHRACIESMCGLVCLQRSAGKHKRIACLSCVCGGGERVAYQAAAAAAAAAVDVSAVVLEQALVLLHALY